MVGSDRDENGKLRQRILLHLGSAEKFLEKDIDNLTNGLLRIKTLRLEDLTQQADAVEAFGQIWALFHLSKELKISQAVPRAPREEELDFESGADGWVLLITPDREVSKEEAVERYCELRYVEHGFGELKHSLNLRPNFCWTEKRIRAHVMVCFLAFQLAVVFEKRLAGSQLTWQRAMEKMRRLRAIRWRCDGRAARGLVRPTVEQRNLFEAVGTRHPTLQDL